MAEQTATAARQTATAKYNTLVYDDFSDPNSGWEPYEDANGSAGHENGGYRIRVITADWLFWDILPDIFPNDVRIEVDAAKIGGPDYSSLGVMCRYQDSDNNYSLEINTDGYAAIFRQLQGEFTVISSEDGKWQKMVGIYPDSATNHIRADCVGSMLTLYVNGVQIATATDDTFTGGQVGLTAGTSDTGRTDILFDNFYIYRP